MIVSTALGSMNIFTAPIAMYCGTSYDKCTYCKSLWIKASAKCPECKLGEVRVVCDELRVV